MCSEEFFKIDIRRLRAEAKRRYIFIKRGIFLVSKIKEEIVIR